MKTTPILDRMLAELPDFRGLLSLIPDAVRAGAELVPTPSGFDILLDESRTLHVSVATMAVIVNDTVCFQFSFTSSTGFRKTLLRPIS